MLLRLYIAYWELRYLGIVFSLQLGRQTTLGSNPRQGKEVYVAANLHGSFCGPFSLLLHEDSGILYRK
jgi:hypothetical protein